MVDLPENVRTYLSDLHIAVIGTIARDGSVHQTGLWYELRDDSIIMNTGVETQKVRNLRRDARASVCVAEVNPARHVTLDGTITFDEDHVMEDLTRLASRYAGPDAGPGIAANIAARPHITLRLTIDRVRTFGKI